MRVALAITGLVVLAACGGAETSQANDAQANIAKAAVPAATAGASMVTASVSGARAAAVMHERHEGMEAIGKNFKALRREMDSSAPDLSSVGKSAAQIHALSRKAGGWFPAGTGPDAGKTDAKAEIWRNPQDFAGKMRNFQVAAQAFKAAAAGNDLGAVKAKFGELGQSCKACHDKYRAEKKH